MTTTDFYPPGWQTEQSPHASEPSVDARRSCAPSGDLPVTEQEEEAWLNKLRDLAGMTT